jgi:alpha-L-fucosidase 2
LAVCKRGGGSRDGHPGPSIDALGYPEAKTGSEGCTWWYIQDAADGLRYCVCVETRCTGDETLAAIAITSTKDAEEVLALARKRCVSALAFGYNRMLAPHAKWWKTFWGQSSVTVPEQAIQKYYVFARYLYGAGSRRGAPPLPLQGVWSASDGTLPPWHGDYHNDLNTQMTYIAYQESGNFEEGASYLDFLWNLRQTFRDFARNFYLTGGLAVPGVMSLAGQPLGGWGAYSLSPTMSAWNAHLFYLHWRFTADDDFLRARAYPWCSAVGQCLEGLLKPDEHGILKLLRSSSPEIGGDAYLEPNSNYDIMCMRMLFLSLEEMADACHKPDDAKHWAGLARGLGDYHAASDGELMLDSKQLLRESHRHLSNIIALYPFNLITREGDERDYQRITASLTHWGSLGTSGWCGYTWAWMSCLRSRVGDAEAALHDLEVFQKAFILRNSFHANGDETRSGYSDFTSRPFTLEGNFLGEQAVQEMLLQSWSPTPGKCDTEIIRIFPSTPWRWHEASFRDLRAEGGHRVSAMRENNATTWFHIELGKSGVIRIRDNFGGRTPPWTVKGVRKIGENFDVSLPKGQTIEAILARPANIADAPANVARLTDGHRDDPRARGRGIVKNAF